MPWYRCLAQVHTQRGRPLVGATLASSTMVNSKTSADERSRKLQQQAQNLLVKADHQMVVSAMKTHGSAAASCCKRALISMGFIDPATNSVIVITNT